MSCKTCISRPHWYLEFARLKHSGVSWKWVRWSELSCRPGSMNCWRRLWRQSGWGVNLSGWRWVPILSRVCLLCNGDCSREPISFFQSGVIRLKRRKITDRKLSIVRNKNWKELSIGTYRIRVQWNDVCKVPTELDTIFVWFQSVEAEREATVVCLADENGALRARLRGVAHSPLSDSEKRQLLLAPAPRRMHSSAPASIALANVSFSEIINRVDLARRTTNKDGSFVY